MRALLLIRLGVLAGLIGAAGTATQAQLAITEVMSSESTNLGTVRVAQRADFWELTNFGTNAIDLSEYLFNDEGGVAGATNIFTDVSIRAGESIIFAQVTAPLCTNEAQFRAWWGESNLPGDLQIHFYQNHGFSSVRDAVQLWRATATSTTLVQRVDLYEARRGFTFTYDPLTARFDGFSNPGEPGVFKAVQTDDIGSPGYTRGPVPLTIQQQPEGLTLDAGTPAIINVRATGLPVPSFQWRFNGTEISGATSNSLTILAPQPADEGSYTVQITNGLMTLASEPAVLQVNTVSKAPRILIGPADLTVTPGQTATFMVALRGYPSPTLQWRYNGAPLSGETNRTLLVANATFNSAGTYSVSIQNSLGFTNAAAVLTVRPKPKLFITEMMGGHSANTTVSGHGDWWELTNFDTNEVNLRGYRFDDKPGVIDRASTVTNDIIIRPRESVLFIQDMTPEAFTSWWGEQNLPENVQFVRYSGNGFDATDDSLKLWNSTAFDSNDWVARADYLNVDLNFEPVRGLSLSFWCDEWIEFGEVSVIGRCGGVRALEADDIGSPGYVTNHPPRSVAPRCLSVSRDGQGTHLTWKTVGGTRYELQRKDALGSNWTPAGQHMPDGSTLTITDAPVAGLSQRFYRLQVLTGSP